VSYVLYKFLSVKSKNHTTQPEWLTRLLRFCCRFRIHDWKHNPYYNVRW
jgi:hypothetical protein